MSVAGMARTGAPTGIVRLSDLVPGGAGTREGSNSTGTPSVASKRVDNEYREGGHGLPARLPAGASECRPSPEGRRGRVESGHGEASTGIAVASGGKRGAAGRGGQLDDRDPAIDVPATDARIPGDSGAHGDQGPPLHESLFGADADTKDRRRRERTPATALQRALGLLTRREHSRKELTRKLVSRGVDAVEVEVAVDKLAVAGWQDEHRFAESLVRARAGAGYGPLHVRAELGTHDLPAGVADEALAAFEGNWAAIAEDLVRRRFARIDDARLRERKAADLLIRRGFPSDIARSAARTKPDRD